MIRYRECDGKLIYEEKDIESMSKRTGLSKREIMHKIQYREQAIREGGYVNAIYPYFERDHDDPSLTSGRANQFLRLYFADTPTGRIKERMGITDKELELFYKRLLGIQIPSDDAVVDKSSTGRIPPEFWCEWEAVRKFLLSSGYNLKIPIVKEKQRHEI